MKTQWILATTNFTITDEKENLKSKHESNAFSATWDRITYYLSLSSNLKTYDWLYLI